MKAEDIARFRRIVWSYYRKDGRHDLPWRKTADPYRILVSEVMLQQTQVERVRAYYAAWLKRFPNVRALAKAPLSDVLIAWQGLGYNRRAKMLHDAAKMIVAKHGGKMPASVAALEALPGVGPYTARAVAAFARNEDVIFIETNIRTAVLHHFFPRRKAVADAALILMLERALPRGKSREWYAALMDYGSQLKRSGVKRNAQSKHYTKQPAFGGSDRQARGAILKELANGTATETRLLDMFGQDRRPQMKDQLAKLRAEGFVARKGSGYCLAR